MEDHRPPGAVMLTSWKEIASFFHRDVRTVQRWEREEGLPVRRHPHQRRSSVYAYHEELEKWWARYQQVGEPPPVEAPAAVVSPPRTLSRRWATLRWTVVGAVISVAGLGAASLFLYGGSKPVEFALIDVALLTNTSGLDVRSLDDVDGDGRGDIMVQPIGGNDTLLYLAASGSAARSRPDVRITADVTGHVTGTVVGDVDGDGLADLVVSSLLNEPATYFATGSSYLVKGRRRWPDALRLPRDADTEFYLDLSGDIRMGPCAAPGGVDLNADGLRDVVVGGGDYSPPGRPSAGAVFVLFGRQSWPKRIEVVSAADVTIHGSRSGDALRALCATGDFTADGRPDLALVASEDTLWGLQGGRGRVYVFSAQQTWPRIIEAERDATLRVLGSSPAALLAAPLLSDVNGDAVADLVVGIRDPQRRGAGGRVVIVFGGPDRRGEVTDANADVLITGGPTFGHSLVAVDVNLDGLSDLVVREPGTGLLRMFLGRPQFKTRGTVAGFGPIILTAGSHGDGGMAQGDFDGDGAPEIALEVVEEGAGPGNRRLARLAPSLAIGIDIRPGAEPNVLVPGGVVSVDVSAGSLSRDLDPTTLRLAGVRPTRIVWQDFDGDGKPDLRLYFDVDSLPLRADTTRLALRGRTRGGLPVAGSDNVVVAGNPTTSVPTNGAPSSSQRDK